MDRADVYCCLSEDVPFEKTSVKNFWLATITKLEEMLILRQDRWRNSLELNMCCMTNVSLDIILMYTGIPFT